LRAVGSALAVALRDDVIHNRWGPPGHFVGRLGKELVALPSGVAEALSPLLDDQAPLIIDGSEAPAISDLAGYRIADLAAYLLSKHRGSDRDAPEDMAQRDRFITALKG
jgi:hypothetical protein